MLNTTKAVANSAEWLCCESSAQQSVMHYSQSGYWSQVQNISAGKVDKVMSLTTFLATVVIGGICGEFATYLALKFVGTK